MKPVFADAFYFVACLNRADQHHGRAVAFATQYTGRILTTWCVLTETADALAASSARAKAHAFITALESDPAIIVAGAERELLRRGLRRYGERPDKNWTLTDCVSFIVMEDNGLVDALTGDHHFEQAGFRALLK
jgi:predicted nucleic acid-binding protein